MHTELVRSSGTALHRQLFVILREQILRGEYAPGAMIPNEDELCRAFDVSRITVRRAVADLEARGLLEKRQGRGTFVAQRIPSAPELATLAYVEALRASVRNTKVTVIDLAVEVPPREVALGLGLREGEKALKSLRLHVGARPVMLSAAWVQESLRKLVTRRSLQKKRLFEILQDAGIDFGRVVQEVTAVAASPFLSRTLEVDVGAPLVRLMRLLYDTKRRPVQHLTLHFSSERSRLLMELAIGDINTLGSGAIIHDLAPQ